MAESSSEHWPRPSVVVVMNTADFFVERLKTWGVKRIFGYPGDGINGVIGALQHDGGIDFIQARHEEMAAFEAVAYAKFTGELGVCLSTGGPGATHLITGLYDAHQDHMPVLAICGQGPTTVRGANYQQELNLDRALMDVAEYVQEVTTPAQLPHVIDRAIRLAIARRQPCAVILPKDVQEEPFEAPKRAPGYTRSGPGYSRPVIVPEEADLRRAADILNAGERVAMLIGAGASGAVDEVIAVAETLGAGVAKALLGKSVLPDDLPFVTGSIGLLGTKPSSDLMNACDRLLIVGSGFPWSEFLPENAPGVQIDIDPAMLSLRYPCEVNLHGSAAETLRLLLPMLKKKTGGDWRQKIEGWMSDWWETLEARAMTKAHPVNPQRVVWEMSPRLPDNVIVTSDSGSCANWYARDYRVKRGQMCSLSGGLASMGAAVPYAIGAKFAHPDRPVVALVGDGAMQMNNMAELITIAKYWERWPDKRLVTCVFNNEDLNQVTWEQRVMMGNARYAASQDIPDVRYSRFAELIGLKGIFVDDPKDLGAAWDEALSADRPVVLEVKTDPEIAPLPPHISFKEAKKFMFSMTKDDDAGHVIADTARQVINAVLHKEDAD
jgi:pyruvate dehydrogenase (quinone)